MIESSTHALQTPDLRGQAVPIGRYILHRQIARGGMATIHIARLMGAEGFSRIVAAKRLHPEFAEDAEFVAMFLDEARIASKVHHRNVVPVLDVIKSGEEVILVQEYVHGVPLQWLLKSMQQARGIMPVSVAVAIGCQVLAGLHATHETVDELGAPLHIVHRDVSPQNVMIAIDGSARLLDFGVAKAVMTAHVTREGTYKGKLAYSAPEQLRGAATRQSDVYSLSVLLWELLVGQRMHRSAKSGAELVMSVLNGSQPTIADALSAMQAWDGISAAEQHQLLQLDPIVSKGLAVEGRDRWSTAAEMEEALTFAVRPASPRLIADWLKDVGRDFLEGRDKLIAADEESWRKQHGSSSGRSSLPVPRASSIQLRTLDTEGDLTDPESSVPVSRPGIFRSAGFVIGFLCSLVMVLAVVIALVMKTESPSSEPLPRVVAPEPTAAPTPSPAAAAIVEPRREPTVPKSQPAEEEARIREVTSAQANEKKDDESEERPKARRSRAPATRTPPAPEVAPPAAASSQRVTQPTAATDCSTPYYFEGSKKMFKPACI
jgi:serine/threonine-protein kinase